MIKVNNVVSYIVINQEWSAAKVEATANYIGLNRKLFTSLSKNCFCNSFEILFPDPDLHRGIEYQMTTFLKLTFYFNKIPLLVHDYYLPKIVYQYLITHTYSIFF